MHFWEKEKVFIKKGIFIAISLSLASGFFGWHFFLPVEKAIVDDQMLLFEKKKRKVKSEKTVTRKKQNRLLHSPWCRQMSLDPFPFFLHTPFD